MFQLIIVTLLLATKIQAKDTYSGCNTEKGCFGMPFGCVDSKDCKVLFSYQMVSESEFNFELVSDASVQPDEYIAIGFSQDTLMRNDSVIACTSTYSPSVWAHWNFYYYSVSLQDPKSNIANDIAEFNNGQITCTFSYAAIAEIDVPAPANNHFSLNLIEDSFHLLLATGPVLDGKIQYHSNNKLASFEPIDLSLFSKKTLDK